MEEKENKKFIFLKIDGLVLEGRVIELTLLYGDDGDDNSDDLISIDIPDKIVELMKLKEDDEVIITPFEVFEDE